MKSLYEYVCHYKENKQFSYLRKINLKGHTSDLAKTIAISTLIPETIQMKSTCI